MFTTLFTVCAQCSSYSYSITGVQHTTKPIFGVQFHPEVDLTVHGREVLRNFCYNICNIAIRDVMKNRQVSEHVFLHPAFTFLSLLVPSITSSLADFIVIVSTSIGYIHVRFFLP